MADREDQRFILKPMAAGGSALEVAPGKTYTLGRSKCCDMVFKDRRVSRRHCQILVSDGNTLLLRHGVEDGAEILLKPGPMYVNSEKLTFGRSRVLVRGDRVYLVKDLEDVGFLVEETSRTSLKELEANVRDRQGKSKASNHVSVNYKVKRIKASVERLIGESRELRSQCNIRSFHGRVETGDVVRATCTSTQERREGDTCTTRVVVEEDVARMCKITTATAATVELYGRSRDEAVFEFCPGSNGLRTNKLEDVDPSPRDISLAELLAPVEGIQELFVVSFVTDIIWFISSFHLSKTLPVTIVCHDSERSWSTAISDRIDHPYCEWPNLKVVYPPFPVLRRTKDKSRMRGVGCHHPKFFLVKRSNHIRLIVTSANLNYRQWMRVSNTVWWQDFPVQCTKNFAALFCSNLSSCTQMNGDFAAYLAGFVSTLVKDVPSEAHWATDLACYDFSKAAVSLVASVPGFLEEPLPFSEFMKDFEEIYLGTVTTTVAGISHQFAPKCDPRGSRLRKLAVLLSTSTLDSEGMVQVQLRRKRDEAADLNAVIISVVPSDQKLQFLEQNDLSVQAEEVPIGFLPKRTASWISTLCDTALCNVRALLWPKQMLAVASGQSKSPVQLALHVFEGPKFKELSEVTLSTAQESAMSNLFRHTQRKYGLWRLQEVLSQHKWPDSAELDFVYCSSSVGTSLDSKFLASFSDAAGRKATSFDESCESDPEWRRWTAAHEAANPSIKVIFPTLSRLRRAKWGASSYRGLLYFPERTWERLKSTSVINLHDAIPYPPSRDGIPMHVKVAQRRFKSGSSKQFGWIYTGSHNFSPAAWGKRVNKASNDDEYQPPFSATRLHICNYELGIVLLDPPSTYEDDGDSKTTRQSNNSGIDNTTLPFLVPAPKFSSTDRPATGSAIFQLVQELGEGQRSVLNEAGENECISLSDVETDTQEMEDEDVSSRICL